jgi:hypothetical protein
MGPDSSNRIVGIRTCSRLRSRSGAAMCPKRGIQVLYQWVRTPTGGPQTPRMPSGPPWAGLGPPRVLSIPLHKCLISLHLTFGHVAGGTQVIRPTCALVSLSSLRLGFGTATWLVGTWQEPSARSKLVAHI